MISFIKVIVPTYIIVFISLSISYAIVGSSALSKRPCLIYSKSRIAVYTGYNYAKKLGCYLGEEIE